MGRLAWTQQAPCGTAQQRCWLPAPQRCHPTAIRCQATCTGQPATFLSLGRQACLRRQSCSSTAAPSSLRLRLQAWSCRQRRHGATPLLARDGSADSPTGAGEGTVARADLAQQDRLGMTERGSQEGSSRSDESGSDGSSGGSSSGQSDSTVARVPLSMPRRSLQLQFTCGKCGATTQRMINPVAWNRGLVFAQCGGCEVWHNIRDAAGLIKEYRLKEVDDSDESDTSSP